MLASLLVPLLVPLRGLETLVVVLGVWFPCVAVLVSVAGRLDAGWWCRALAWMLLRLMPPTGVRVAAGVWVAVGSRVASVLVRLVLRVAPGLLCVAGVVRTVLHPSVGLTPFWVAGVLLPVLRFSHAVEGSLWDWAAIVVGHGAPFVGCKLRTGGGHGGLRLADVMVVVGRLGQSGLGWVRPVAALVVVGGRRSVVEVSHGGPRCADVGGVCHSRRFVSPSPVSRLPAGHIVCLVLYVLASVGAVSLPFGG